MRFYQARADTRSIDKGEDYDALPELYVIFICIFDYFGYGDPLYEFEYTCKQRPPADLQTGTHLIIVNSKDFEACDSEKLRSLLRFIKTDVPDEKDELIMELADAKNKAQATLHIGLLADPEMDERVRKRYYLMQGREEGRKEVVERMQELLDSGFSVEEAMNIILEETDSSQNIDH